MPVEEKPCLYLTFDDGPIPNITEWVLDELKNYNAKATFFCIGNNINKHPEVFERIKAEGHTIGHHTENHLNGWKTPLNDYLKNAEEAAKKVNSKWFRPPYGKITSAQAKALGNKGFQIVMWNVLSKDYSQKLSAEQCWNTVKRKAKNGSIIVFHDSVKAEAKMRYALAKTLKYFSLQGFQFKAL